MLFTLTFLLVAASPVPSATPDPYKIYASAMQNLASLDQPSFIDTTENRVTTVMTGDGARSGQQIFRAVFDSIDRRECVFTEPGDREAVIGPSFFAPDMWLLGRRALPPEPPSSSSNMAPDLSDLRIIADVVSVARPAYEIRLAGTVADKDGSFISHLVLRPLTDPKKHNLRELWIDSSDDRIVRAIIRGSYKPTPEDLLEDTYVQEDFGQVGPYWLVVHRIWTYVPPLSGVQLRFDASVLTMRFPQSVPSWLFDELEFKAHAGEVASVLVPWSAAPPSPSPSPPPPHFIRLRPASSPADRIHQSAPTTWILRPSSPS
jgi:hypothetical protein